MEELETLPGRAPAEAVGEPDYPIAYGWRGTLLGGLLRAARPKQWIKNGLVVAAPAAAGVLGEGDVVLRVLAAFAAFTCVSSGTYLLNDVRDLESDRSHPRKRERPIAAAIVPVPLAVVTGVLLLAAGLGIGAVVAWELLVLLGGYVAMTAAYTLWLKHVALMDIVVVSLGFILRAAAGGLAVGVPISQWFLIVASFGSLFMVSGKRYAEHAALGVDRAVVRATLATYSSEYLRFVWTMACGVTVAGYCLWAFEIAADASGSPWYQLSIVPFVVAMLRYALLLDTGEGSAPEDILLRDRFIQVVSVVWALTFGLGVYVG